ncbi:polysaccharide pyruvyl transferase family protein [Paramicrobacterium fandaimingii]|uniref:polysaccharide pyruvyl transferase family protein n=1 Tax=Paramicrobacterium fandaimingii TaxID=2708079 RepID=UPI001421A7C9|nr:polysaccharide pyruvyl transferase family protein [Microbacterium fandaimingii]
MTKIAPPQARDRRDGTRYPRERTVRLALFGEFGIGNMGNDMSGHAMIALVRSVAPDSELTAISPNPAETTSSLGIPALPIRSPSQNASPGVISRMRNKFHDLGNLVKVVSRFDAVIVPGTGLLERVEGRAPGGDQTWMLLLSIACWMRRVPLAWFAVGGSQALPMLQRLTARAAGRVPHYRSFRDHATALSLRGRARDERIVPDIVFSCSVDTRSSSRETGIIGLAVIDYKPENPQARERYLAALAEAARDIVRSGRRVKFLLGDLADTAPAKTVHDHAAAFSKHELDNADPFGPLSAFVAAAAECDVVIASRYHALVASALAATPVVAVAHADKDVALMEQLGLSDLTLHADTITSEQIIKYLSQCSETRSEIRSRLIERTDAFRTDVLREFARSGIALPQRRILT